RLGAADANPAVDGRVVADADQRLVRLDVEPRHVEGADDLDHAGGAVAGIGEELLDGAGPDRCRVPAAGRGGNAVARDGGPPDELARARVTAPRVAPRSAGPTGPVALTAGPVGPSGALRAARREGAAERPVAGS